MSSDFNSLTFARYTLISLNPFGTGQCLPTSCQTAYQIDQFGLNPFGTGQCLPTKMAVCRIEHGIIVSIPLEQGSVFRQDYPIEERGRLIVSIPLEQGSVFRPYGPTWDSSLKRVSIPLEQGSVFRRGRKHRPHPTSRVSIPLEQGSVFRLQWYFEALWHKAYESHFPTFSET